MNLLVGTKTSSFLLEFSDVIDPASAVARQTVFLSRKPALVAGPQPRPIAYEVSVEGNSIRLRPSPAITSGSYLIELATGPGGIRSASGQPIANAPGGNIVLPINVVVG